MIFEKRTHRDVSAASRELQVEMHKALSESKRLRRRICRLLATARVECQGR